MSIFEIIISVLTVLNILSTHRLYGYYIKLYSRRNVSIDELQLEIIKIKNELLKRGKKND